MMTALPDLAEIARARRLAGGLADRRRPQSRTPELRACLFDDATETFHLWFEDGSSADLSRSALRITGVGPVVAWSVDEVRQGVEVAFADGTATSFSAALARDHGRPAGPSDLAARVAQRVRALREERGWTIAELGDRARMAAPNLSRVESGRHVPAATTLVRLAEALGVPLARLTAARPGRR